MTTLARNVIPPLVSVSWLCRHLKSNNQNIKLIDTSWTAESSGYEEFVTKRIAGSVFLDLNRCVKATPTIPRNLPEVTCFRDYIRSLGVDRQSHLVLYDRSRIHAATRAWWTLKYFGHDALSVLDGGLIAWEAASQPTESGQPAPCEKGNFDVVINKHLMVDFDGMTDLLKHGNSQIVDARKRKHFLGLEVQPAEYTIKDLRGMGQPLPTRMLRGHIPGSLHLHKDLVLDQKTMCFHTKDQLMQIFSDHGIDVTKPMTTLCYGGHSATLINMAARICGQEDTALYYGSWTEWGQLADDSMVEERSDDS